MPAARLLVSRSRAAAARLVSAAPGTCYAVVCVRLEQCDAGDCGVPLHFVWGVASDRGALNNAVRERRRRQGTASIDVCKRAASRGRALRRRRAIRSRVSTSEFAECHFAKQNKRPAHTAATTAQSLWEADALSRSARVRGASGGRKRVGTRKASTACKSAIQSRRRASAGSLQRRRDTRRRLVATATNEALDAAGGAVEAAGAAGRRADACRPLTQARPLSHPKSDGRR